MTAKVSDVRMLYRRWMDLRELWPSHGISWEQVQAAKDVFEEALAELEGD